MEISKTKPKKERTKKVFKTIFDSPFDIPPTLLSDSDSDAALAMLKQVIDHKQGKVLIGREILLRNIRQAKLPTCVFIFYNASLSPIFKEVFLKMHQLSIPHLVLPHTNSLSLQNSLKIDKINLVSLYDSTPDLLLSLQPLLSKCSLSIPNGLLPLRTVQLDATRKQIRKRRPKKKRVL